MMAVRLFSGLLVARRRIGATANWLGVFPAAYEFQFHCSNLGVLDRRQFPAIKRIRSNGRQDMGNQGNEKDRITRADWIVIVIGSLWACFMAYKAFGPV